MYNLHGVSDFREDTEAFDLAGVQLESKEVGDTALNNNNADLDFHDVEYSHFKAEDTGDCDTGAIGGCADTQHPQQEGGETDNLWDMVLDPDGLDRWAETVGDRSEGITDGIGRHEANEADTGAQVSAEEGGVLNEDERECAGFAFIVAAHSCASLEDIEADFQEAFWEARGEQAEDDWFDIQEMQSDLNEIARALRNMDPVGGDEADEAMDAHVDSVSEGGDLDNASWEVIDEEEDNNSGQTPRSRREIHPLLNGKYDHI